MGHPAAVFPVGCPFRLLNAVFRQRVSTQSIVLGPAYGGHSVTLWLFFLFCTGESVSFTALCRKNMTVFFLRLFFFCFHADNDKNIVDKLGEKLRCFPDFLRQ